MPSETASPAAQVVPFKGGLGPFAGEVGPFEAWRGALRAAEQERDTLVRQFGAAHVIRTTLPGRYAVQLGAFSQLKLARRLAWRVLRDGGKAFIQSNEKGDETRYTVLVGGFADRSEAETRAEALSAYVPDAFVTQTR